MSFGSSKLFSSSTPLEHSSAPNPTIATHSMDLPIIIRPPSRAMEFLTSWTNRKLWRSWSDWIALCLSWRYVLKNDSLGKDCYGKFYVIFSNNRTLLERHPLNKCFIEIRLFNNNDDDGTRWTALNYKPISSPQLACPFNQIFLSRQTKQFIVATLSLAHPLIYVSKTSNVTIRAADVLSNMLLISSLHLLCHLLLHDKPDR